MVKRIDNTIPLLTQTQIDVLITGFNFWGTEGEYGPPPAPFLNEEHKKQVWFEVKDEFMELIRSESSQNIHGDWRFRESEYLPYGPVQESIHAYWECERGMEQPWPAAPKLGDMQGT